MAKVYVQKVSEKGAANGYAGLDSGGKVPATQLPALPSGVPDPSGQPDNRWLKTSGGALVYTNAPSGSIPNGTADNQIPLWNNSSGAWVPTTPTAPTASDVSFVPGGTISANTVGAAIAEAAAEAAQKAANLSDLASSTTARTNLGLGTAATQAATSFIASTALDTDGTLAANSDSKVASQKAVRTYVAANSGGGGGTFAGSPRPTPFVAGRVYTNVPIDGGNHTPVIIHEWASALSTTRAGTITEFSVIVQIAGTTGCQIRIGIREDLNGMPGAMIDQRVITSDVGGKAFVAASAAVIAGQIFWVTVGLNASVASSPSFKGSSSFSGGNPYQPVEHDNFSLGMSVKRDRSSDGGAAFQTTAPAGSDWSVHSDMVGVGMKMAA